MNGSENWEEIPLQIEEVPADESGFITENETIPPSAPPDERSEEEAAADSVPDISKSVDVTETLMEVPEADTLLMALNRIHFDMSVLIFLLLFFWMYERIKVGIRNFKKLSK